MKNVFFTLALILLASTSHATENRIYNNFASCKGLVDGVSVSLDFFEEFDAAEEKPTGKGYWYQETLGMKVLGMLNLETLEKSKKVQLLTAFSPETVFTNIELSMEQEQVKLDIIGTSWSDKLWGSFDCKVTPLPED